MIYFIPKNWHNSIRLPSLKRGHSLSKKVILDNTCKYKFDTVDDLDWNKLIGYTFNFSGVHRNSLRIGWRYNSLKDIFELSVYYYLNGVKYFNMNPQFEVGSDKMFHVKFVPNYTERYIDVLIDNKTIYNLPIPENIKFSKKSWGWKLFPYFGGNRKSPHLMRVEIKK
jgi:hypothetical protein